MGVAVAGAGVAIAAEGTVAVGALGIMCEMHSGLLVVTRRVRSVLASLPILPTIILNINEFVLLLLLQF